MSQEIFGDRLLVVDDEPAFGTIVKRVAQGCGFEVVVTETAGAFINAARLWHPTVILLDLKIPGSDGIELLRSLAADKCQAHVVLSSGADDQGAGGGAAARPGARPEDGRGAAEACPGREACASGWPA